MSENALYELQPIADDPRFEGFGFVNEESILEFDFDDVDRDFTVSRLKPTWTPQHVAGRVREFNDYPCIALVIPAFSRRAVDALRDLLEPNGELLPLISDVGEYYAYNITTVSDILDEQRSLLTGVGSSIGMNPNKERYECFPEKMDGLSIFRLRHDWKFAMHCVAQPFVDRVRKHGLRGFRFNKLWPLAPGVSWFEESKKQRGREEQAETPRGRMPVKGNTVVVCIALAGDKPTKTEKQRTKRLLDEADAILHDPAAPADARYFGSVERDEFTGGESRLFISCPDADALTEKLRPWVQKLAHEMPVRLLKRYGEYVDHDACEEWVKLGPVPAFEHFIDRGGKRR